MLFAFYLISFARSKCLKKERGFAMSRYKKKVVIFAICLSVFFTSSFGIYFDRTRDAYAFDFVITPTLCYALVSTALVGSGVIWHNRNDIVEVGTRVYNHLKAQTEPITNLIKTTALIGGAKAIQLTTTGATMIGDFIDSFKSVKKTVSSDDYSKVYPNYSSILDNNYSYKFNTGASVVLKNSTTGATISYTDIYTLKAYNNSLAGLREDGSFRFIWAPSSYDTILSINGSTEGSVCVSPPSVSLKNYSGSISADNPIVANPSLPGIGLGVTEKDGVLTPDLSIDDVVGKDVVDGTINGVLNVPVDNVVNPPIDTPIDKPDISDPSLPSNVNIDFSPLYFSFADKFPFCIPFDLVNSIRSFSVKREIPKFDIKFDDNYFLGGGSFIIDFTDFSWIATILRYFILLTFVVSLVKITRDLMKG